MLRGHEGERTGKPRSLLFNQDLQTRGLTVYLCSGAKPSLAFKENPVGKGEIKTHNKEWGRPGARARERLIEG